jgi:hypothetical protein
MSDAMGRQIVVVLYVVAMVAAIVGMDVVFFRHLFWARLAVNAAFVALCMACYWRFLSRR